ncbi:hypothetical protein MMC25_006409 [Agyrium rufum]|nr:hypothetical protein [Agyrium rufum]
MSATPMEDAIRTKITEALDPTAIEIYNDSANHAHHRAMAGNTSPETHFRVLVTSEAFRGKTQIQRHRLINGLLKNELNQEGGIHALQLQTKVPEIGAEGDKDVKEVLIEDDAATSTPP